MTATATVPGDDLELSFEAVLFGSGEKESGERDPLPPSSTSSASVAAASAAFSSAGGDGGEHAGGAGNANRRRFSAAARGQPQQHQQQQEGGGGGSGRPRSSRNPRHSFSGCVGASANQRRRHDKDPSPHDSSADGFIAPGEIVPTALVIKNIAFAVKRDQFLSMMEEEGIMKPYAFNYHYDNGVFRGLAFANYTTPEETDAVLARLNGMEFAGRKLRVELKRAPPGGQAEKDRRLSMRAAENAAAAAACAAVSEGAESVETHAANAAQRRDSKTGPLGRHQRTKSRGDQDLDWRETVRSRSDQDPDWRDTRGQHIPPSQAQFQHYHHSHPQQQPPHQHHNQRDGEDPGQVGGKAEGARAGLGAPQTDLTHSRDGSNGSGRRRQSRQYGSAGGGEEEEIDLDDPEVRDYYEQVRTWKQDRPKSPVLDFPPTLTSQQRKILHRIAGKLGLYHISEGGAAERHIRIMRTRPRNDKGGAGIQITRPGRALDAPKLIAASEGSAQSGVSTLSRSPMNRPSFKNPDSAQPTFGPIRQPRGPDLSNNFAARRTQHTDGGSEGGPSTCSVPVTSVKLNASAAPFNFPPSSNPPSSGNSPHLVVVSATPPPSSAGRSTSLMTSTATATAATAAGGSTSQGPGDVVGRPLDVNAPSFVPT